MPLTPAVSRRALRVRIGLGLLYLALALGGITMVYPFMLMVATSITSEVDSQDLRIIPRFLYDEAMLYRKYLSSKYGIYVGKFSTVVSASFFNRMHDGEALTYRFEEVNPPDMSAYTEEQNRKLLSDWYEFRARVLDAEPGFAVAYFLGRPSAMPAWTIMGEGVEDYRNYVDRQFQGNIAAINEAYKESLPVHGSVAYLLPQQESPWAPAWLPNLSDRQYQDWKKWQRQAPPRYADVLPLTASWHRYLEGHPDLQAALSDGRLVEEVNRLWGTQYKSLVSIPLPERAPLNPSQRFFWESFVRNNLSRIYLRFEPGIKPLLVDALTREYETPERMQSLAGVSYASFEEVPVPERIFDVTGQVRSLMQQIIASTSIASGSPLSHVTLITPESLYRNFLRNKFTTLDAANAAYGWAVASWDEIEFPRARLDWLEMKENKSQFRWWMICRNYRMVTNFIAGHGHALFNTAVLCIASILFTLTINPLCAYSLSRYGLPYSNQILIYLLATMAFPPSVAMIPSFLLLRDFNLLNTYWALLLPGAANGFTIFMMKGFFDTLPKELFEAAKIDGATELRMFFQILIPLCKPVFGYFALGAFTSAYAGFIWAFTICPKEEMWTMMVWLYQLTTMQPASVQMAALVMAAIPTLLVFTVVQNIILKGIVLPSFH